MFVKHYKSAIIVRLKRDVSINFIMVRDFNCPTVWMLIFVVYMIFRFQLDSLLTFISCLGVVCAIEKIQA